MNVDVGDVVGNTGLVLDSLPRAIIIADRDARIVAWNKASTHLYRWSAEEVMGRSILEIVAPADLRETARSIVDGALAGQVWSGDVRLAIRTGETLRTFCFVGPLADEHGSVAGAICAADDRSELHALSARASSLTDRLLLALSAGRLGTWQWDAATGVTTWDPMMERLFGLSPGEFTGTFEEWVARLHPDDRDDVLRAVQHSVETAEDYEVEHRVVRPDGTERWLQGRGKVLLDDDGVVIGTIGCSSDVTDRKYAESLSERRVVQAEAQVASERRHRERLEFLAELNDVAISAPSPRALMSQVANAAIPRLGDWCSLHFCPEPGEELVSVFAHVDPSKAEGARRIQERFPLDLDAPAGLGAVLRTGTTEFVPEFDPDLLHTLIEASGRPDRAELHTILDGLQLTSMITVPMITRRSVIGAIRFVSAESGRRYTQNDVALAEAAAGRVGESLVNAWLIDEQRRIAATLQAALLPPLIPRIDGVEIATRYWAAGTLTDVGGDFYDVFPVGPNRWAIVIGDVCGTGPQAAAVTAIARHTIRAAATHGQSHQNVMRWVNEAIINSGRNTFCTAIYATLERRDDSTWTFTTAIGGHLRPILVSPGTRSRVLGTYGTLIGMVPNVEMSIDSYDLAAGDRIILYTDGVTDLPPPHGLSEDQLLELIDRSVDARHNGEAVASAIGDDLEALMPIVERHDDVALLVLRLV